MLRPLPSVMSAAKHILVLGGNGFIGAETVLAILNKQPQTKVTLVNRGRSWDWDKLTLLQDKVTTIKHNRLNPLSACEDFAKLGEDAHFSAVLDFSGYEPVMVQDSVRMLGTRTDLYIYISSDSVYEVCGEKSHTGPTKETDDARPVDLVEQRRLNCKDDYGHQKLQGEECIQKYLKETGENCCSFINLRLADVIGARDGTNRWWQYQVWLKLAALTQTRVQLPKAYKERLLSFVYVKDIANLITKLLFEMPSDTMKMIDNQSFNLACIETPTLDQFIGDLRDAVFTGDHSSETIFEYSDSESVPEIYPSVERGPIDITKAKALLGWEPTPWQEVVKETAKFYENVCSSSENGGTIFYAERKDIYKSLKKDLSDLYSKMQLKGLKKILLLNK